MSEIKKLAGGAPVAAEYLSSVDNTTIGGNGTAEYPLHVIGGGVGIVHNASLEGDGTTDSPLGTVGGQTAIAHDTTLTGNGTAGSPLGTVAGATAVAHNGSLTGNGTTGSPLATVAGGTAVAVSAPLAGNGLTGTPLSINGAWASVTGGSSPSFNKQQGFASLSYLATGRYLLLMTVTVTDVNQVIAVGNAVISGNILTIVPALSPGAGSFEVDITDSTGTLVDDNFFLNVVVIPA